MTVIIWKDSTEFQSPEKKKVKKKKTPIFLAESEK